MLAATNALKRYLLTDLDKILLIDHNIPNITHYTYRGFIKSKTLLGADIAMFVYIVEAGTVYTTTIWRTLSGHQDGIVAAYSAGISFNAHPLLPGDITLYYVGDNLTFKASDLNIYQLRVVNNGTGKSLRLLDI